MAEDIELVLKRLLDNPIQDEKKVVEIIINAITAKCTDSSLINQAVRQAVSNYENQLRVFMVAMANAHLNRIYRLMQSIELTESKLSNKDFVDGMDDKDLLRLYSLQQDNLSQSLAYVKRIADMRLEIQQLENLGSKDGLEKSSSEDSIKKDLTTIQRDRVRKILDAVLQIPDRLDDEEGE